MHDASEKVERVPWRSYAAVIGEDALAKAMVDGSLDGAALDVFAHEPVVPEALHSCSQGLLRSVSSFAANAARAIWASG